LAKLWNALVTTHYPDQDIDVNLYPIPQLDITSFHLALKAALYCNAHERYERTWRKFNKRAKVQHQEIDMKNQRNQCFTAAAKCRVKRQKFDHENKEDREEVGGLRS
jgi:hypothetical protein